MTTKRLTAEEWTSVYGTDFFSVGVRFWLLLLAVLFTGVVVGVYVLPPGVLPGTANIQSDLATANVHIEQLETNLALAEARVAQTELLYSTINEQLDKANAESDMTLELNDSTLAVFYTVQAMEANQCINYLAYATPDGVTNMSLSPPYACPADSQ